MEEFTIIKFKNEIAKFLVQNQEIREIYEKQRNNCFKKIGFYGIKECYNLLTKIGSERFTNVKIFLKIKVWKGIQVQNYLLRPNQDLRSFNKNEDVKNVDTYKVFNKFRADAVDKTLEKINEVIIKRFSEHKLTLEDVFVNKAVPIKEQRGNVVLMPVEIAAMKNDFTVWMSFHMQCAEDKEPEIFWLKANLIFMDYHHIRKLIVFQTLIPIMSKRVDNDQIPVENSKEVISRKDFIGGCSIIDHTKIFQNKFSHVKLMMHCDDDENLPERGNDDYIAKYPLEFCYLTNEFDYFSKERREKFLQRISYPKKNRKNKRY